MVVLAGGCADELSTNPLALKKPVKQGQENVKSDVQISAESGTKRLNQRSIEGIFREETFRLAIDSTQVPGSRSDRQNAKEMELLIEDFVVEGKDCSDSNLMPVVKLGYAFVSTGTSGSSEGAPSQEATPGKWNTLVLPTSAGSRWDLTLHVENPGRCRVLNLEFVMVGRYLGAVIRGDILSLSE